MKQFNNLTIKKGFTLMEAIVAIFVITAGIVGVSSLVAQTISSATFSKDKLIAAYLAQEGIEIVRNIRDTNWLEGAPSWDDGLVPPTIDCSGGCQADYADQALFGFIGNPLNIDSFTGYYGYDGGDATKFTRKITILKEMYPPGQGYYDKMMVKVEVFWQEKGKPYSIEAQENLYNWK